MSTVIRTQRHATKTWPTMVGLAVLWVLTLADQMWVFAILFLGWGLFDIATGESHFIQRVTRRDNPAAFWAVVITWISMAVLWLLVGV